jgi:hypothetical protein
MVLFRGGVATLVAIDGGGRNRWRWTTLLGRKGRSQIGHRIHGGHQGEWRSNYVVEWRSRRYLGSKRIQWYSKDYEGSSEFLAQIKEIGVNNGLSEGVIPFAATITVNIEEERISN